MRQITTNKNKTMRICGLDLLKAIAVFWVIVLHINGYFIEYVGEAQGTLRLAYNIMEAVAYPAVHIFVLCGSYLLSKDKKIKWNNVLCIYILMFLTTITGLFIMVILDKDKITAIGLLQSILPFSLRAYGYVSSYIILIMLSPFLNVLLDNLSINMHKLLIGVWGLGVVIMPTFFRGTWPSDYMSLFILLYMIASFASRCKGFFDFKRGIILWIGGTGLLAASYYIIPYLGPLQILFRSQTYFYQYNCLFVVGSAVGLFMALACCNFKHTNIVTTISSSSLFVYLCHMHPIIKGCYNQWEVFAFLKGSKGMQYFIKANLLAAVVLVIGVIIGTFVTKAVRKLSKELSRELKHIFIRGGIAICRA